MAARPADVRKSTGNISPARREAFAILLAVATGPAYADDLLRGRRVTALSMPDRHLCTTLVLGVLRWQIALDARIRPLLAKPNARLDEEVSIALRLGAFQLWFLDRIPAHAAISESVELVKAAGHRFASGMVNAVLRKAAAFGKEAGKEMHDHSCTALPQWIVERWSRHYSAEAAQEICRQAQMEPELALRVSNEDVETALAQEGITTAPGVLLTSARRVVTGDVTASQLFRSGRVWIQEEGSQLIAELACQRDFIPRRILDCCAAPGGKTLVMAERNPPAQLTACEISPQRCAILRDRINNAGMSARVDVIEGDATQLDLPSAYDFVLADVPCSGTGTMGRNPEIRHRLSKEDLSRHHQRQCAILRAALRAASAPHARVLYSTCSLEPEENDAVVAEVLTEASGWNRLSLAKVLADLRAEGRVTAEGFSRLEACVDASGALLLLPGALGPQHVSDGFYMALLERKQ